MRSPGRWAAVGLAALLIVAGLALLAPSLLEPPSQSALATAVTSTAGTPLSTSTPEPALSISTGVSTATATVRSLRSSPTVSRTATLTAPSATPAPRTPGPTVAPDLALEFTKVKPNQYLGYIASSYGVSLEELVQFSGITDPDMVPIGQGLIIPHHTTRYTPAKTLVPDSEAIYGIAYRDFDVAQFVEDQGGYLASVRIPKADGGEWTGAQLVERVAERYSVGPRVLLALMEARSDWVTDPDPQGWKRDYPLGHTNGAPGLLAQLEWTANELNRGFYGWQDRGETAIRFEDGIVARGAPGLNPGTVAVQRALAGDTAFADMEAQTEAFSEAYRRLFGDPAARDAGPVLPAGLEQPALTLPWAPGEWWHLTGGPHGGWVSGSGWAALDFVPENAAIGGCWPAEEWARAAADGVVARNNLGEILLDLDGDGDVRTGWVLQYLHIVDRPAEGTLVKAGEPLGRPSCEGGAAEQTHLHFARRYNGLWVDAGGPVPMVLDGWTAYGGFEYEGGMRKPGQPDRVAGHSRDRAVNGLVRR